MDSQELILQISNSLRKLNLDSLVGLCEQFRVAIPDEKKGNLNAIYFIFIRHLNSEAFENSDDKGVDVFTRIHNELLKIHADVPDGLPKLEDDDQPEPPVKEEQEIDAPALNARVSRLVAQPTLKITGSIGNPGQKDTISYQSLSFEIKAARKQGYKEHEIRSAVIKAIKP